MKLIPRLKPYFNYKELLAVFSLSKGNIKKYENVFSKKFGCEYGVMFLYGRSALYSFFKVWGLTNDEIICPAYTCVVVPHAVVLSGNTPVFVDCQEGSFNMSYDGIKAAITDKTRAIIVTHLFGYPMDIHRVSEIIEEAQKKYGHKIFIIQDAGHSFGAKWQGEVVTQFGDAAIFGLSISKIVGGIFGGMATTNNKETYEKLAEYRQKNFIKQGIKRGLKDVLYLISVYVAFNACMYGFVNWLERKGFLDKFVKYYDECKIYFEKDWNHYPSETEAKVGLIQLQKYDDAIKKRVANAKVYIEKFGSNDDVNILPLTDGATYSHCVALVEDREQWVTQFRKKKIQLGVLIEYAIPDMPAYREYRRGDYPVSQYYSKHAINFPNWPGVDRFKEISKLSSV